MVGDGSFLSRSASGAPVGPLRQLLTRKGRNYKRMAQVLAALGRYGFASLQDARYLFLHFPTDSQARGELGDLAKAKRMRQLFEELGPTFIKLGQLLSTRPDLVPAELVEELGALRDNAPPEDLGSIEATVREQLGKTLKEAYATFDPTPVAAASIGQVHKATLPDGTVVAVKVQRTGITQQVEADMEILEAIAELVETHIASSRSLDLVGTAREFRRMLRREMDYTIEARSIERFVHNFEGEKDIVIPRVHWSHSAAKVLTMDFIDGVPVSARKKVLARVKDPRTVTDLIGRCFIQQIFLDGYFHADPHQGNLFVLRDGRVSFLDFGAIGYLDRDSREEVAALYLGLINRDVPKAARALVDLAGTPTVDMAKLELDLQDFLDFTFLRSKKLTMAPGMNQRIVQVAMANGVMLPSYLVLLERALLQIEGVCRELDPDFDLVEVAKAAVGPLLRERLKERPKPLEMLETATAYRRMVRDLPHRVDRITAKMQQDAFTIRIDTSFLEDLKAQGWRMVLAVSLSLGMTGLLHFYAVTGTQLKTPLLGLNIGVAAIVGVWAVALAYLYVTRPIPRRRP